MFADHTWRALSEQTHLKHDYPRVVLRYRVFTVFLRFLKYTTEKITNLDLGLAGHAVTHKPTPIVFGVHIEPNNKNCTVDQH